MILFLLQIFPFIISSDPFTSSTSHQSPSTTPNSSSLDLHHQISSTYHEYHPDFILFISHSLGPSNIYLEIQDTMDTSYIEHHLVFLSQYITSGAIVLVTQSCSKIPSAVNSTNRIYCLNGILSREGITMESLDYYLQNTLPGFIKFSNSNGLFLQNSEILKQQQSLFYIRNEYQHYSRRVIEMFLSAGPLFLSPLLTLPFIFVHQVTISSGIFLSLFLRENFEQSRSIVLKSCHHLTLFWFISSLFRDPCPHFISLGARHCSQRKHCFLIVRDSITWIRSGSSTHPLLSYL
jgi:hypothetical protein